MHAAERKLLLADIENDLEAKLFTNANYDEGGGWNISSSDIIKVIEARLSTLKDDEVVAKAICVADGVDPEHVCYGMGHTMPKDWVGPAWKVRLKQARAAIKAMGTP